MHGSYSLVGGSIQDPTAAEALKHSSKSPMGSRQLLIPAKRPRSSPSPATGLCAACAACAAGAQCGAPWAGSASGGSRVGPASKHRVSAGEGKAASGLKG